MQGAFPPAAKRARNAALAARVKTIPLSSSIGVIWSAVAGAGGKLFLGTGSALWVFEEDTKDGLLTLLAGHPSEEGFQDGQGVEARFNIIAGLALERDGSVLVSDKNNHCLRHVSQLGRVTTFVGGGQGQYVRKTSPHSAAPARASRVRAETLQPTEPSQAHDRPPPSPRPPGA